jgi:hypothetical protein
LQKNNEKPPVDGILIIHSAEMCGARWVFGPSEGEFVIPVRIRRSMTHYFIINQPVGKGHPYIPKMESIPYTLWQKIPVGELENPPSLVGKSSN